MISVKCPHCQAGIRANDRYAGRVVACPGCKKQVQIPGVTEIPPAKSTPSHTPSSLPDRTHEPDQASIEKEVLSWLPSSSSPVFSSNDSVQRPHSPEKEKVKPPYLPKKKKTASTPYIIAGGVVAILALLVIGLFATGTIQFAQPGGQQASPKAVSSTSPDTSAKQSPEPRSESPTSKDTPAKDVPPGKVRITVTWQYNNFVGTKPDTGAVVILIPKTLKEKVHENMLFVGMLNSQITEASKRLREQGVFVGLVGGDGKVLIPRVPPGDYIIIIVSKNTRQDPALYDVTKNWLNTVFEKPPGVVGKNYNDQLSVTSGEETEFSHDFGNTYL